MLNRRKRRDALIEATREELSAADAHARAALAEAMKRIESRSAADLAERERLQLTTQSAIAEMQRSFTDGASDIARALTHVANMCAMVAEQIEEDRLERRVLTEALSRLARQPRKRVPAAADRVIGGTVFASPAAAPDEISIIEDDDDGGDSESRQSVTIEPAQQATPQVASGADDFWMGGVEIADVTCNDDTTKYWLRRRADGYIFPQPFDADDLPFPQSEPEESTGHNGEDRAHWSKI